MMVDQQREDDRLKVRMARTHFCAECGNPLVVRWDGNISEFVLSCGTNWDHKDYRRGKTLVQSFKDGEAMPIELSNMAERKLRREVMPHGNSKALAQYQGVVSLTKEQATEILNTIWPKAPKQEVVKAAMICHQYGLNPLMKHLYLVEFSGKHGSSWAPIMGIGATRLIASRRRKYSYKDGPRLMTEEDQIKIFGEADKARIWAITVLKDEQGNEAPGYGNWPKDKEPHGSDKGNTKANMAMIRSERQAFDRLLPGEMPQGIDVIDAEYITEAHNGAIEGRYRVIDGGTGEITEEAEPFPEVGRALGRPGHPQDEKTSHPLLTICPEHEVEWQKDKFGNLSHIVKAKEGDYWCKAKGVFRQFFEDLCERHGWGKDNSLDINNWLKKYYGNTWSQLNEEAMLQAIEQMRQEVGASIQPPEAEQPRMGWGSSINN